MQVELRKWVIPASVGVSSFALGIGVGYAITKIKAGYRVRKLESEVGELKTKDNKLEAKHDELETKNNELESDVTQLRFAFAEYDERFRGSLQQVDHVIKRFKDDGQEFLNKFTSPTPISQSTDHPSTKITLEAVPNDKEDDTMLVNVFSEEDDDWDYDEELKHRGPNHPYIIHRDEYFSNEMDYRQSSLMYYAGDNILCDELDVPVYNPEKVVGKLMFGHGSRDPNICYVRNEALIAEYEILCDPGFFQVEVLGQEKNDNMKHSKRILKFRDE